MHSWNVPYEQRKKGFREYFLSERKKYLEKVYI